MLCEVLYEVCDPVGKNSREIRKLRCAKVGMLWFDGVGARRSKATWGEICLWKAADRQMRTVEFYQALGGMEGAQFAPFSAP